MPRKSSESRPSEGEFPRKYPTFDILQHLDKLVPDGGSCNKGEQSYHCPICNSSNFKVNLDGPKKGHWSTWGCDCAKSESGKQKIKDAIAPLTWEKPVRAASETAFTYDAQTGMSVFAICQVRRRDDGNGKRSFSQWTFNESKGKWVPEVPDHIKNQIHLFKIFDPINQDALSKDRPIILVEGEGKVNRLHALGIAATCSIGGAGKWEQYGYTNYLKDLAGANLILCPDRDEPGIKHVERIAQDFPEAKWLYPNPGSYLWERAIPRNKGFDISDWIDDGATAADILGAIGEKRAIGLPVVAESEALPEVIQSTEPTIKRRGLTRGMTTLQMDAEMIEEEVGHLLRWDSATNNFYLGADRMTLGRERLILSTEYGLPIKIGKEDCMDICVNLALKNTFNSVADYLDSCQNTQGIRLLELANKVLGTTDELQSAFFRNWLVAAVARAYDPGCQVDEVIIFQGGQGQAKSKIFPSLVPHKEWFNGNGLKGNKITDEEIRNAQRTWLIEVPEIDRLFKKACASELKAFMTTRGDWMRQLYEKMPELYLRNSVMGGTTNEDEVYTDDTGNRRYCMVQVKVPLIDTEWIVSHRDSIWAAARDEYKVGMIWHLTESQKIEHARQNRQWKVEHPWQGMIEYYLKYETQTTVAELLHNVVKLDMDKVKGRSEQMQVAGIIKFLGFKKTGSKRRFMEQEAVLWRRDVADETGKGMEV